MALAPKACFFVSRVEWLDGWRNRTKPDDMDEDKGRDMHDTTWLRQDDRMRHEKHTLTLGIVSCDVTILKLRDESSYVICVCFCGENSLLQNPSNAFGSN